MKLTYRQQLALLKRSCKSDGCTGVPDFDFGSDCCAEHDLNYQVGDISRAEADKLMRQCIQAKGYILLPWVYWAGVRLFAGPIWRRYRKQD
jgi:hypothetical protein